MSEIDNKYVQLGGTNSVLGKATSSEGGCADGKGRYRHYANGSIFWHPLTGAHEVHGLIHAKWAQLKSERGFLGYPVTDESASSGGAKGRYNLFQGGAITWKQDANEAFETHGAIRDKFWQMGAEAGLLGFPMTDETKTSDNVGRFAHFEHGSIFWKPSISAHEVHGDIRAYWSNHGWETNSELGYPISDETLTFQGSQRRFSDFENGVLYWNDKTRAVSSLPKFPAGSQPADQVISTIKDAIVKALQFDSRIYIKSGPLLRKLTDYSWDGAAVHNRFYKIYVGVGIHVKFVPDPTSDLDFWIEISFDRGKGTAWSSLHHWEVHTHVPWPTSTKVSASEINSEYKKVINPMVGVPQNQTSVPDPNKFHLLSAKVMPNGDLNVYLQPLLG